ncbi:hypothetical protein ACQJ1I_03385 [Klebsiella quasipneumoniae]|uniref:hypothetical protein n=1 Tax=Klebsiella quasipneumoniae TaxID=1463165 RepID=UPI003CFFC68A
MGKRFTAALVHANGEVHRDVPKPGFPKRFFGFDGTNTAGDTLSDLWLFYNHG